MNCRMRTSFKLLGMPQRKNRAVTSTKGRMFCVGRSGCLEVLESLIIAMVSRGSGSPHFHPKSPRHILLGGYDQVAAATSRVHRSGIAGLEVRENGSQVHVNRGVFNGMREDGLPALHAPVH